MPVELLPWPFFPRTTLAITVKAWRCGAKPSVALLPFAKGSGARQVCKRHGLGTQVRKVGNTRAHPCTPPAHPPVHPSRTPTRAPQTCVDNLAGSMPLQASRGARTGTSTHAQAPICKYRTVRASGFGASLVVHPPTPALAARTLASLVHAQITHPCTGCAGSTFRHTCARSAPAVRPPMHWLRPPLVPAS